ncbi:MAG: helix-turn-helix domain-containing protein, partial [Acidobacteriota bacterium]
SEVEKNRFRRDLFYRLGVIRINIPPLRERVDDIEVVANYFLDHICKRFGKVGMKLDPKVCEIFRSYHWPGNIRELQNVLEGAIQLAPGNTITSDLFQDYLSLKEVLAKPATEYESTFAYSADEKQKIMTALSQNKYNKTETAKALGMSRRTLYRRLEEYGLV